MRISRNVALTLGLALACQLGLAADQSALRVSQTLTMKKALDESERTLLRLESRVGQTLIDDRALINDLLARLERMAVTVTDVHKLLTAMPATQPCKPVVATCPTAPSSTAGTFLDDLSDLPWLPIAGGAGILVLLGLWFRHRSRSRQTDFGEMTVMPTSTPASKPAAPTPAKPALTKPLPTHAKPATAVGAAPAPIIKPKPAETPAQQAVATPIPPEAKPKGKGEADLSLELADVMLSMGLTDGAAQTLSDHIRQHPRQALYHWLKLLEIYRQSGRKAEFDKAAAELQQHFNVAPPEWQEAPQATAVTIESIEEYAHISGRMQELWPRRSCAEYLNRLLEDNRGGTRAGFPQPVIEEILLLLAMLKD
jgi:hypothetical protein